MARSWHRSENAKLGLPLQFFFLFFIILCCLFLFCLFILPQRNAQGLLPTLCFRFQTIVQVPTRSKGRPNSTLPSSSQVPLPIWLPSFQVSNSKLPRFQCFIANLGLQCFRCHRCQALQVEWKGTSWDWEIVGISWIMLNAWSCWGYRRHSFSICNFSKIWLAFPGSFFPNFLDQTLGRWRRHDDDVTTTWRRHDDDVTTTWRRHGDDVTTTWRRHDDDVTTTWRRHGDDVTTTWRRHGDDATLPPHCRHIGCHNCHKTSFLPKRAKQD